jgi:hypothetical protein
MQVQRLGRFGQVVTVPALALATAIVAPAHGAPPDGDLPAQVNAEFGLRASHVLPLNVDPDPGQPAVIVLPAAAAPAFIDGPAVVALEPHSVRSVQYRVLVELPDGSLEQAEPGPVRTMRGRVLGIPGSDVSASICDDGVRLKIVYPDDDVVWIEPVAGRVAGAWPEEHVLFRADDVLESDEGCGAEAGGGGDGDGGGGDPGPSGGGSGSGVWVAELAVDTDHEYYQDYGSVAAVEARVNDVVNAINLQYERDMQVRHEISTIIVRTSASDPYSATSAQALAYEFREHWMANHGTVPRDVAQLFSGKNLDGTTIGWAFYDGVCTSYAAYGIVESDWSTNFARVTDLSAHELGHNWSGRHCSCTSPGYTMNSYITGANVFSPGDTIPGLVAFRDSRTCLTQTGSGDPTPIPAAPTGLSLTAAASDAILSWTDNSSEENSFEIERSVGGGAFGLLEAVPADTTTYTDAGLAADTTYAYRVRATNAAGASGYTNVAEMTTEPAPPAPTPPAAPTDMFAQAVSESEVDVWWTTGDDSLGVDLERSVNGGTWEVIATIDGAPGGAQAYVDTGLEPETTVDYRAAAFNDDGYSDYSEIASATTDPAPAPAPAPDPLSAPVQSMNVSNGTWMAGDLSDLEASDDGYVVIDASLSGRQYKTTTIITAISPDPGPAAIDLRIESGASLDGVKTVVYLRNFHRGRWNRLVTFDQTTSDVEVFLADVVGNPQKFIESGTNRMKMKIVTTKRRNQAPAGYTTRFDVARIEIVP